MAQEKDRDILSELFSGAEESSSPAVEQLAKITHRSFRLTPSQPRKKSDILDDEDEPRHRSFRLTKFFSRKTTVYLSEALYNKLLSSKKSIDDLLSPYIDQPVSQSRIVNQALKIMLKEFEIKGKESLLLKQIVKSLTKK